MADLSPQQQAVVDYDGNVFVTACPGSGKTRVLTEKVVAAVSNLTSPWHRVIAVTFTNRAADEVTARLDDAAVDRRQIWTGTIHAFALEWILRPYAGYIDQLRFGFSLADEYYRRTEIDALRKKHGVRRFDKVETGVTRTGDLVASDDNARALVEEYREGLRERRMIDFDLVLYLAYEVMQGMPEIPKTLSAITELICIDEYQDTQDLQYGILSTIVRASAGATRVFIVGDKNQAIYTSLGGVAKSVAEIRREFGLGALEHRELSGNYRSTQRIVDFCGNFQAGEGDIRSLAEYAGEPGTLTFSNREVDKGDLPAVVADLIKHHLNTGLTDREICVLAPNWRFVVNLSRKLLPLLPDVDLDLKQVYAPA